MTFFAMLSYGDMKKNVVENIKKFIWNKAVSHQLKYGRYLLLLDSIRQCEGVAQLLQSSQGKEVAVKPNKNNKVSPAGTPSH